MTHPTPENYQGPSELILDDYLPLPPTISHMQRLSPGVIHSKTPGGLYSEFVEFRAPIRFYLAKLITEQGEVLGELTTGAGSPMAELLSDLCHALADGTAMLYPCPPLTKPVRLAANACLLKPPRTGRGAVLMCNNLPFLGRVRNAVEAETLALELKVPHAPPHAPPQRDMF